MICCMDATLKLYLEQAEWSKNTDNNEGNKKEIVWNVIALLTPDLISVLIFIIELAITMRNP